MRIKELRIRHGLTQEKFGKIFGVSGSTVLYWECEIHHPPLCQLTRIADYFHVSIDWLVSKDDSELKTCITNTICAFGRDLINEVIIALLIKTMSEEGRLEIGDFNGANKN